MEHVIGELRINVTSENIQFKIPTQEY